MPWQAICSHDCSMSDDWTDVNAFIFDLDGVITDTADQHFRAWKTMLDDHLRETGKDFEPFTREDYLEHVDGKPRLEGLDAFLRSRGVELPRGAPDDGQEDGTLWGLGNRKNACYRQILDEEGVEPFADAVTLLRRVRDTGLKAGMASSSRNARAVVQAADLAGFFDAFVDGTDLSESGFEGKPEPDLFLEAAKRLETAPGRAAVFEDARAGVEAGRRGGFRRVVGVAREGGGEALREAGADLVVRRLDEIGLVDEERT